jgi:hypothetical protein
MNNGMEIIWKEAVVAYFMVLPLSEQLMSQLRIEWCTSTIHVKVTHLKKCVTP